MDQEPFLPIYHRIKHLKKKLKRLHECSLLNYTYVAIHYEPITLMTVATINIIAKKPKETPNPTPESIASFRLLCTSFSNSFTVYPSYFTYSISHSHEKIQLTSKCISLTDKSCQNSETDKRLH